MKKTLVLVRHGKPEPAGGMKADFDRELTPAGRAALAGPDGFARAFAHLTSEERSDLIIWNSPAVRAQQTAEEASRVLDGALIAHHECLWEQENGLFLSEVASSDARCIVAVGHIPFMNEIAAYLTHEPISFKPGGVAAIDVVLKHGMPAAGACKLLWFEQGPEVA